MKSPKKVFSWTYDATRSTSRRKIHRRRSKADRVAARQAARHLATACRDD